MHKPKRKIRVGIAGATGYTGYELVKILHRHPEVEIAYLAVREDGEGRISDFYPALGRICDQPCLPLDADRMSDHCEVIFFALPHKVSMGVIPQFLGRVNYIIDLSADYRLKNLADYAAFYGSEHLDAEHLSQFVYGLPEHYRSLLQSAHYVANPGCFPTSIELALMPAICHGLIETDEIKISSMTGISGGGRTAKLEFHFPECNENIVAYKVGTHQHQAEIEQELSAMAGKPVSVIFVPHLVPMTRGIFTTIYARLRSLKDEDKIQKIYQDFYRHEPFVRINAVGRSPQIKHVVGTNFCDLSIKVCGNTIILMSAIDNLLKGASGQAVQNMNVMLGIKETSGLI